MRKARPSPPISGDNDLVPVFDTLDQIQSRGRAHSPTENIQIYPLSQNLRQGYKLHVTSHCKDIEQNWRHGQEEGEDERRHQDVTVSLLWIFSRPNVPYCGGKSTVPSCACLVMRVSNQANNHHPNTPTHTQPNTTVLLLKAALLSLPIHIV